MFKILLTSLLLSNFGPSCLQTPNPPLSNSEVPAATFASQTNRTAKSKIQVALLLDTSNSMDGLIDQAKAQLWKMVNRLADAQRQNEGVELEIALY